MYHSSQSTSVSDDFEENAEYAELEALVKKLEEGKNAKAKRVENIPQEKKNKPLKAFHRPIPTKATKPSDLDTALNNAGANNNVGNQKVNFLLEEKKKTEPKKDELFKKAMDKAKDQNDKEREKVKAAMEKARKVEEPKKAGENYPGGGGGVVPKALRKDPVFPTDIVVNPPAVWKKAELPFFADGLLSIWNLIFEWQMSRSKYVHCFVLENSYANPRFDRLLNDPILAAYTQFKVWRVIIFCTNSCRLWLYGTRVGNLM